LRCVAADIGDAHPGAANGEAGVLYWGGGFTYVEDDLPDEMAVGEVLVPEVEVGDVAYGLEGRHRR
jgi:hypothetical protein